MAAEPGSLANATHILRVSRRVTIRQLQAATGVPTPYIVEFELGRRKLPSLTIAKLVRAMGLRVRAVQLAQTFDLELGDAEIEEGPL